jgi:integrase
MDGFHFHDLRHTGNTLAAATGASTKELMARMGHASARAALIYQHASAERDVLIAEQLSAMTEKALALVDKMTKGSADADVRPATSER